MSKQEFVDIGDLSDPELEWMAKNAIKAIKRAESADKEIDYKLKNMAEAVLMLVEENRQLRDERDLWRHAAAQRPGDIDYTPPPVQPTATVTAAVIVKSKGAKRISSKKARS